MKKRFKFVLSLSNFNTKESKNHYTETHWSKEIDGEQVTITIKDIEDFLDKNNVGITNIKVDDIFDMCVHKDKTDKETIKRSEKSDLSFPILIAKDLNGDYCMILDGHHRLLKAKNNNIETIKARVLDLKNSPKEFKDMFC